MSDIIQPKSMSVSSSIDITSNKGLRSQPAFDEQIHILDEIKVSPLSCILPFTTSAGVAPVAFLD